MLQNLVFVTTKKVISVKDATAGIALSLGKDGLS